MNIVIEVNLGCGVVGVVYDIFKCEVGFIVMGVIRKYYFDGVNVFVGWCRVGK